VEGGSRNCDSLAFDRTDEGAHPAVTASFRFRIVPPKGEGAADGFGFALLDVGVFGATGAVSGDAEEPAFAGSLGVGFDVYNNFDDGSGGTQDEVPGGGDHVSVYFDEELVQAVGVPFPLTGEGAWSLAEISVVYGTVTVTITPPGGSPTVIFDELAVPGLVPNETRVYFGARSGGGSADHDFDTIDVAWSDDVPPVDGHPGEWSEVIPLDAVTIHLALMPDGELLFWGRFEKDDGWFGQLYRWDPLTFESYLTAQPTYEAFCAGHSQLSDGRILLTGGHLGPEPLIGVADASIYDPFLDAFTYLPDMNAGRWYPTNLLLPNGDTLVVGGSIDEDTTSNPLPQVLDAQTGQWRSLIGAVRSNKLYPWLFVTPSGGVFEAGPQQDSRYLDVEGDGAWQLGPVSNFGERDTGTALMYEPGRIAIFGGARYDPVAETTNTVEVIDLNDAEPTWRVVSSMAYARRHVNSTMLPDGTVLITGGTSGSEFNEAGEAVLIAELWDPVTETLRPVAAMQETRIYHSTALLLPDGRVMS
jgi:hypothetical protein